MGTDIQEGLCWSKASPSAGESRSCSLLLPPHPGCCSHLSSQPRAAAWAGSAVPPFPWSRRGCPQEGRGTHHQCPTHPSLSVQWSQSCSPLPASASEQVTMTVLPELMDKLPVGLVAAGQGTVCLAEGTAGSPRVPPTGNLVQGHGERVCVSSANPSILVPAGAWAELPGESREDVLTDVLNEGKGESCSQAGNWVQTP